MTAAASPRGDLAVVAIERSKAPAASPLPATKENPPGYLVQDPTPAEGIAASMGAVVESAVRAAVPYGDRGADFSAEADIEHRAADGSTTRAKISFKYGARR
jgi:hypothetical protein